MARNCIRHNIKYLIENLKNAAMISHLEKQLGTAFGDYNYSAIKIFNIQISISFFSA